MDKFKECAAALYTSLLAAWESEENMTKVFEACHRGPTFDRTEHGRAVVQHLFDLAWVAAWGAGAPKAVLADRLAVLKLLIPLMEGNFNLLTQVAMNLVDVYVDVDASGLLAAHTELSKEFAARTDVHNPFDGKRPKVKVSSATHPQELVRRYAYAQGIIKAKAILEPLASANLSFRITPNGRTPALNDSGNFSNLPAVGDAFYRPNPRWGADVCMGFLSWGDMALSTDVLDDGSIDFVDLPRGWSVYKSESGGTILQQVMLSRCLAHEVWRLWANTPDLSIAVIPRMNSIQVFGSEALLKSLPNHLPAPVVVSMGSRVVVQEA